VVSQKFTHCQTLLQFYSLQVIIIVTPLLTRYPTINSGVLLQCKNYPI